MIASKDRSDWFGASDISHIMGKWTSRTFEQWWAQKLGINTKSFCTIATQAGTYWEHRILESIGVVDFDRQILVPKYRLRVNLDGELNGRIKECKTYKLENGYKPTKTHVMQVRVQMWATDEQADIVSYGLEEKDYENYFRPIDIARLQQLPIAQDEEFIKQFLQRLQYLADCLTKGRFPKESDL